MSKYRTQVCNSRSASIRKFINDIRQGLDPLVDDDKTGGVDEVLGRLQDRLADICKHGLTVDWRQEAVDQALDSAVKTLTELLGVSARLAVCMAIASLCGDMRSRRAIAA